MNGVLQQQQNRTAITADDAAISVEYIKALVEAQTGRAVKFVKPMQIAGRSADFTAKNTCFFALSLQVFPIQEDRINDRTNGGN